MLQHELNSFVYNDGWKQTYHMSTLISVFSYFVPSIVKHATYVLHKYHKFRNNLDDMRKNWDILYDIPKRWIGTFSMWGYWILCISDIQYLCFQQLLIYDGLYCMIDINAHIHFLNTNLHIVINIIYGYMVRKISLYGLKSKFFSVYTCVSHMKDIYVFILNMKFSAWIEWTAKDEFCTSEARVENR